MPCTANKSDFTRGYFPLSFKVAPRGCLSEERATCRHLKNPRRPQSLERCWIPIRLWQTSLSQSRHSSNGRGSPACCQRFNRPKHRHAGNNGRNFSWGQSNGWAEHSLTSYSSCLCGEINVDEASGSSEPKTARWRNLEHPVKHTHRTQLPLDILTKVQ